MESNELKARIVHKHDVEVNWKLAVNFIPYQGELIIYDIDENYNYERFKIGDGVNNVNDLPFKDQVQVDWNQSNESAADYIKNRTHYEEYGTVDFSFSWDSWLPPGALNENYYSASAQFTNQNGLSIIDSLKNEVNTSYVIKWGSHEYIVPRENVSFREDYEKVVDISIESGEYIYISETNSTFDFTTTLTTEPTEPMSFEIIGVKGGEPTIKQLDSKFIPDYISKTYVDEKLGDIQTALDSIIAMQNSLIGGNA